MQGRHKLIATVIAQNAGQMRRVGEVFLEAQEVRRFKVNQGNQAGE